MLPQLIFMGKVFSAYMLIALVGILTVLLFTYKMAQKNGLDEIKMLYLMLFGFLGVFVGGHILYGLLNFPVLIAFFQNHVSINFWTDLRAYLIALLGGSVFYGGLMGAMLAAFIYLRQNRNLEKGYIDIGALAIPLFHTFGRIGCFLSGCCYGKESSCGIIYHYSLAPGANGIIRVPVQLYEAIFNFCLFALLFWLFKKEIWKGKLLAVYLLGYSSARFGLEFLRGDVYRGFLGGFSTSQIISVIIFVLTLGYLLLEFANKDKKKKAKI